MGRSPALAQGLAPRGEMERCWYCGCELIRDAEAPNGRTRDHQTPKSRGGKFLPGNQVWACRTCNQDKADRTLAEYRKHMGGITFNGERRGE